MVSNVEGIGRPTPAQLIGAMALRLLTVVGGLACFSFGIMLTLQSRVGLGPWDVFHQGLANRLGLAFGTASIIVGFAILLLAWVLGARPGVATVLNMLLVGGFVNLFTAIGLVPDFGGAPLAVRLVIDIAGVMVVGFGTALYIKASLGAGPRDGLMLALARRTGGRVSVVRGVIELCALAIGFFLGGTAGIGTLIFALGAGPAVGLAFRLLRVEVSSHKR
ncbi:MAG TPA: membrane protein [Thermomicrobiales bacterium]